MRKFISIFLIILILFSFTFPILSNAYDVGIRYQVHLKDKGWINTVSNGQTGGTTGQARRMEAIAIARTDIDGRLTYKVHCEDYGWLGMASEGEIAGTTGMAKRMEAIIINLENSSYDIKYRVHVQDYGWMNWVNNGEIAGTTGQCRRIEAIQIKVEKKKVVEKKEENVVKSGFGIDVSKHQGDIDWSKVKKSGIEFAMIRCGYRGYTEGGINEDSKFVQNVKGAYNNGIKVGLYFYSSAISENEAKQEAEYVISLIKKYELNNYINFPIAFDIEDFEGSRSGNLSIAERTQFAKIFCDTILNAGYKPMIYSYTYFLDTKMNMTELKNYDIWIADYYGNTWYKGDYKMWQYSSQGKIDGIDGDVDLNYCYL